MFWGLIMEPLRRYSQKVKKSFHVSMAALDISTADEEPTQVICSIDNRNYLLCTLQKGKILQVPLDLNFEVGDTVCFATNGKANVHLTGYLSDEFDDMLDETEDGEKELSSEEGDEEVSESDVSSSRKRLSLENDTSPPKKKSKTLELLAAIDSQKEETDSDDSDVNLSDLLGEEEEEDSQIEGKEEEEEDDDDEDEENEEEESESEEESSDDDEEASSLSDEETEVKKTKVNGVPIKKQEKKKQQEQVRKEPPQSPAQREKQQKTPKNEKQQQAKSEKAPKAEKSPKAEKTPKAEKAAKAEKKTPMVKSPTKSSEQTPTQKRTVEGGVIIEDIKPGNGAVAKAGRIVQVYYEGRLKNNNKMFDSTTKGPGFKFRLGRQEVIKGWDVGVAGMKVGGKRRITCPPNMAYGQKGSPPVIPGNATLVFEVELKNVN